jgi:hypothetical protein
MFIAVLVRNPEGKRTLRRTRSWLIRRIFKKWEGGTECIHISRMETGGGLLWVLQWNLWFHKMRGSFWQAKKCYFSGKTDLHGVSTEIPITDSPIKCYIMSFGLLGEQRRGRGDCLSRNFLNSVSAILLTNRMRKKRLQPNKTSTIRVIAW